MPTWLVAKTLDLPRWVWVSMLVGGVGIGLYLRHKKEPEESTEPSEPEESESNSGGVVPPAAPIGSGGEGVQPVRPNKQENFETMPEIIPADTLPEPEIPNTAAPEPPLQPTHNEPAPGSTGTVGVGGATPALQPVGTSPAAPGIVSGPGGSWGSVGGATPLPAPAPFKHNDPISKPPKRKRR
jgi:hypothetical protein